MCPDTLLADSQNGNADLSAKEVRRQRASLARHARKCTVCHHEDREFIDQDYLRWLSPKKIAREYAISHHSVIYRHADATGLRAQRRASLRSTLENFIEQAECVRATAGSVVAAVRLYAQINDQGQWTPPVRRHIVEHRYPTQESASPTASVAPSPVSHAADASRAATFAAVSAIAPDSEETKTHPAPAKGTASSKTFGTVSPGREAVASQATGASPSDHAAPMQKKNGLSSLDTLAANFAAPPAEADKNSGPVRATASFQPVATITVGSAVPQCASPEKFPAVRVASINLGLAAPISNREHVELERDATH